MSNPTVPRPRLAMRIRAFETHDTDAVVALRDQCGLIRPWNDPLRDIQRKLAVQRELFLIGAIDGRVMGSAMAGYDGHRGWVNYLAVSPADRGAGHARALITEVERMLVDLGCPKLNLQVRADNEEALGFYRALGYIEDHSISLGRRLISDGVDKPGGTRRPAR